MVNPIEVQTFVVRAVDASQAVNQIQNAAYAAQHTGLFETMKQAEVERSRVNPQEKMENKNVRSSTEGSSSGTYVPFRRPRGAKALSKGNRIREDKKGILLDVRL